MYKQTTKKEPKRYDQGEGRPASSEKPNFIQKNKQVSNTKKLSEKSTNQPSLPKIPPKGGQNKSIPQKVEQLEKAVDKLNKGVGQPDMQRMLLQQIQGIKSELREIKKQIGLGEGSNRKYEEEVEVEVE